MVVSIQETNPARIILPASKSISNRALIIRALTGCASPIENISDCDDSMVVVEALSVLPYEIDVKAAGTAMRFLTSMLASQPCEHIITGTERMRNRPIKVLVDALRQIGADIEYTEKEGFPPLRIKGKKLSGGTLSLPGDVSSQYISSLLMVAPTLEQGLLLSLTRSIISRPYIDMTLAIMEKFGAKAGWADEHSILVSPIPYSPVSFVVESDWSAASYWYEVVALSKQENLEVELPGLFSESLQGDSTVANLFLKLGVKTTYEDNCIRLSKAKCSCMEFCEDLTNQPDLAQTMVVTCCMLNIPFRISGLHTLRIKETDRIAALQNELGKLGFILQTDADSTLCWSGEKRSEMPELNAIGIDTYDDHRMAMAFAPIALYRGCITINNPEVVSKSYPNFWKDLQEVGFKLE